MTTAATDYNTCDFRNNLCFGEPTKLNNGQNIVPLSMTSGKFDWGTRLVFQFGQNQQNMVYSQYGLNKPQQQGDPNRRNLDFTPDASLDGKLRELDAAVVDFCSKNCEALFKTKTLNKQFCPIVQDKEKGTVVRVKCVIGGDNPKSLTEVRCFNNDCTKIFVSDYNSLQSRDLNMLLVVSTQGVWFTGSQFGVSFKAESIIVKPGVAAAAGIGRFNLLPGVSEVSKEEAMDVDSMGGALE